MSQRQDGESMGEEIQFAFLSTVNSALPREAEHPDEERWRPWLEREANLEKIGQLLAKYNIGNPDVLPARKGDRPKDLKGQIQAVRRRREEIDLRLRRATLLSDMGRDIEALNEHMKVLALDEKNLSNLRGLGQTLRMLHREKAARLVYAEALKHFPNELDFHINFGALLLADEEFALARGQYEIALRMDPESLQAHGGMYYTLMHFGERGQAEAHRGKVAAKQTVFELPYRGSAQPVEALLLVSFSGGNTPIERLLDDRVFKTSVLVADLYDFKTPLPPHQFIFNGVGDVDTAELALERAASIAGLSAAPVLNRPAAVMASGRCGNAARLKTIPGVITPATATFAYEELAGDGAASALSQAGFSYPLLLRAPGFHMGRYFVRVESASELGAAVAQLPGAGRHGSELLAIEYVDARGEDGFHRKYRVMMVDGELYPLHLAISPHWKIHYFSADMKARPDHRAEEKRFLTDMAGVLGAKAMAGLRRLQAELGLDYGGFDFGLDRDGQILLFEANATMVVEQPSNDSCWDYRRAAVARIHEAVRRMLLNAATDPGRGSSCPASLAETRA